MARFRLRYGTEVEFDAQDAGEVVPFLHERHVVGCGEDEVRFLRRLAIELCEWSGCWFRFGGRDVLAADMLRHGLLERID
jgi:hypothetical protein